MTVIASSSVPGVRLGAIIDSWHAPIPHTSVPPDDLAEAARMLRAMLDTAPPTAPKERATARRIEGAAPALDAAPSTGS